MPTALVTGSNRGIGLALCRALTARGDSVIAVCRTPSPQLAALGVRVEPGVDVADDRTVRALAERLEKVRIELLINNAGIMLRETLDALDFDGIRRQLEVNALGPLRATSALLPRLGSGARIGIITSLMGSMSDNSSGGSYGYRMSKAAVNAAGVSLARDLAMRAISVTILHPGYVRTDMTGGRGSVDPDESARGMLARIAETTLETSGRFVRWNGDPLPW